MPQMAPMNWISLFIFFTLIFLLINSLNYFSFKYPNHFFSTNKIFKKINWKW
uniref:ATP synthase complex subunit 8 n=1 Tax=Cucujoidea sp. 38 KM-2017 TaxID=2219376 RepID=A0A346RHS6_9CUCU|nr:ATP synthase F0 subunit 8 [Cucujoidea sp. 38 KM-2017]